MHRPLIIIYLAIKTYYYVIGMQKKTKRILYKQFQTYLYVYTALYGACACVCHRPVIKNDFEKK